MGDREPVTVDSARMRNPNLRNEDGFIMLAGFLGKAAVKKAGAILMVAGAGFIAAGPTFNMIERNFGVSATVDLEKAHTTSETNLLSLDPAKAIPIADAYYATKADARGVEAPLKADIPGPLDPSYPLKSNFDMTTVGPLDFKLPHSAVQSAEGENGTTDFIVDASKMEVRVTMSTPPIYRYYTVNDGGKNYGDREGLTTSFIKAHSALLRFGNLDTLGNVIDDATAAAEYKLTVENQHAIAKECPKQIVSFMPELIEFALKMNMSEMDQDGKFGKVVIENQFKFTETPLPEPAKKAAADSMVTSSKVDIKEMTFDEVKCSSEQVQVGATS